MYFIMLMSKSLFFFGGGAGDLGYCLKMTFTFEQYNYFIYGHWFRRFAIYFIASSQHLKNPYNFP
jgi:hypothetical protein